MRRVIGDFVLIDFVEVENAALSGVLVDAEITKVLKQLGHRLSRKVAAVKIFRKLDPKDLIVSSLCNLNSLVGSLWIKVIAAAIIELVQHSKIMKWFGEPNKHVDWSIFDQRGRNRHVIPLITSIFALQFRFIDLVLFVNVIYLLVLNDLGECFSRHYCIIRSLVIILEQIGTMVFVETIL